MAGCGSSCGPSCRCDFSSRAPQLPSLLSIEVVTGLLCQAVANSARRAQMAENGDMSPEEIDAADDKLVNWLGATFCGNNRHYASGEGWNSEGLAAYLREMISDEIAASCGGVPRNDDQLVYAACALFVKDMYRLIERDQAAGRDLDGIENTPAGVRFIGFWSRLLVGAPLEMLSFR